MSSDGVPAAVDGPVRRAGHGDDAAQAGVGMDEAVLLSGNKQVHLTRPWAHLNHVANCRTATDRCETSAGKMFVKAAIITIAQAIACYRRCRATNCAKRSQHQAHAIKACCRITAVQTETDTHQLRCRPGECQCGSTHAPVVG